MKPAEPKLNKNAKSMPYRDPQMQMAKLLGGLDHMQTKKVWQGWAKNSQLGQSLDEQLNNSFLRVSKEPDAITEQVSLHSHKIKRIEHENDEYFSEDEDDLDSKALNERKKVIKFFKRYENKLSNVCMWVGHAILSLVPIIM